MTDASQTLPVPAAAAQDDAGLIRRLDDSSDRLSPMVVKEVRQFVRAREFTYSFGITLVVALAVAFYGSAETLAGNNTGASTFATLTACLGLLGFAIVPLGAFGALRTERLEQTLDLISLTALTPRRIVVGKLLAQAVKLTTLFAVMGPFIAMSFLLGGIDFVTIIVTLVAVFMWSLWMAAAALFLSTLLKSKAMSVVLFAGVGIAALFVMTVGRMLLMALTRPSGFGPFSGTGSATSTSDIWWTLAVMGVACVATMTNLLLLAENRLAPPPESRVTPLRVGFLVQFLLILAFALREIGEPLSTRSDAVEFLSVIGGVHLAAVALFAVTEGVVVPPWMRRERLRGRWMRWLYPIIGPGSGRAAVYILIQMALLIIAASLLDASSYGMSRLLAVCGFISCFTGIPALIVHALGHVGLRPIHARVAVLFLLMLSLLLPDVLYYLLWQPEQFSVDFTMRHLLNPLRTLTNWPEVWSQGWFFAPLAFGVAGLMSYVALMLMGRRRAVEPGPTSILGPAAAEPSAGEHHSH
jgi:ABC-type transport system involved in multi-copper enzyme maturation permease subunit